MGKNKRLFMPKQQKESENQPTQESGIPENHGKTIDSSTKKPNSLKQFLDNDGADIQDLKAVKIPSSSPKKTDTKQKGGFDQFNLKMKIRMSKLYRKQIMKPLLSRILSLQLLIEQELMPKLEAEVQWNTDFFAYAWEHYLQEKHWVKKVRAREIDDDAISFHDVPDAQPVITQ